MYSFPYSNFAVPEGNSLLLNHAVKLVPPRHRFIVQEISYALLLEKVTHLESPDVSKYSSHQSIDFFDHLARRVKASGIWFPKSIRNFGKKFLR